MDRGLLLISFVQRCALLPCVERVDLSFILYEFCFDDLSSLSVYHLDFQMDLTLKAINFSAEKLKRTRREGAAGIPFVNHGIAVANLICSIGNISDGDILAAGVLHGIVVDSDATLEEVESQFGSKVKSIVADFTDVSELGSEKWKVEQVKRAPNFSFESKVVRLGDILHNLIDIKNWRACSDDSIFDWTNVKNTNDYITFANEMLPFVVGTNVMLEKEIDAMMDQLKVL